MKQVLLLKKFLKSKKTKSTQKILFQWFGEESPAKTFHFWEKKNSNWGKGIGAECFRRRVEAVKQNLLRWRALNLSVHR